MDIKGNRTDRIAVGLLNALFRYERGELSWRVSPNWSIKAGTKVGTIKDGYLRAIVGGVKVYNHQLIFLMKNGYLPEVIDHVDGNKQNNNIENLRPATYTQNATNRRTPVSNKTGYKGVSYHKQTGKYQAEIQIAGKQTYLGLFDSSWEAAKAYNDAAAKSFGEYSRLNKQININGNQRKNS